MSRDKMLINRVADCVEERIRKSGVRHLFTLPRADRAARTDTNGWWRLIGRIPRRNLAAELWIDRWSGADTRALWFGVSSASNRNIERTADRLAERFGSPMLRDDASVNARGFKQALRRSEFGQPVLELYRFGWWSYYGCYVYPRAKQDTPAMIDAVADLAEAFLSAAAGKAKLRTTAEFPEGQVYERLHRSKERSSRLSRVAKQQRLLDSGKLECEVCGFDFERAYGAIGRDFIEVHHLRPVASLRHVVESRISDLALVCSNCHRMLHRYRPWLTRKRLHLLLVRRSS